VTVAARPERALTRAAARKAGLFIRALDGFRTTASLADSAFSADASAHLRIAYDHMVAFAWIAASPEDVERPLRIGRFGVV
jgi:hypothetical protein